MLLRSLVLTLALSGAFTHAQTRVNLDDSVTQALLSDSRIDGTYGVDGNMGWLVLALQLECTSKDTFTGGDVPVESKNFNCYARPLVRFSMNPQAQNIEILDGTTGLKLKLLKTMEREGYLQLISKWSVAYGGNITCLNPVGTGNSKDKAYCELWKN